MSLARRHGKVPWCFIHTWKTGGTTVGYNIAGPEAPYRREVRCAICNCELLKDKAYTACNPTHRHATISSLSKSLRNHHSSRGVFTFAFVRNPFDWLVSLYCHYTRKDAPIGNLPFSEFLEWYTSPEWIEPWFLSANPDYTRDHPVVRQRDFICDASGDVAVSFLGRFESFGSDLAKVCEEIQVPYTGELYHHKSHNRPRRDYRLCYTEKDRELVERVFAEDLDLLHYTF